MLDHTLVNIVPSGKRVFYVAIHFSNFDLTYLRNYCDYFCDSFKTKGNLTKHMKSKAHYKKCVELGVVPVPTTVCDENIDKEAIARLAAGGGNTEESSEEEEESDGEESEESGSEEQEAAQSLLSLSQRNMSNRLPGLLPSGRPTTYPYTLTLPTTSSVSIASTTVTTSTISQSITTQETALIQNELSHRYYFPSNRSATEETMISVIQSSKKDDSDFEVEEITDVTESRHQLSQPMDLTTKQTTQVLPSPVPQRARPVDILTPVSEPVLLQTIVQTMERLPLQGREWKPDAEGHMLQAYLTERHVMDSKIKQQYRVGNIKDNKQIQERDIYPRHQDQNRSRHIDSNSIPTVTYTDPSKMHHTVMESRVKHITKHTSEDIKMEIREKIYQNNMAIERRTFDYEAIHKNKEQTNRIVSDRENFELGLTNGPASTRSSIEYGLSMTRNNSSIERPNCSIVPVRSTSNIDCHSPKSLNMDINNRPPLMQHTNNDIDRSSMFNAMKMMSEIERSRECHPIGQEVRSANHEMRTATNDVRMQNHSPRNLDLRPPSREIRTPGQEYRPQSQELRLPSQQEYKIRSQEMRPPSCEYKPSFAHDMPVIQELMPSTKMEIRPINPDNRPPSRDTRALAEYRTHAQDPRVNYEILQPIHEPPKSQNIDARSTSPQKVRILYYDTKHTADMVKQNTLDNMKHAVAGKIVVGGSDFQSPSSNTGNGKPQAEFLQPSSGPAPNYVR